MNSDWRYPTTVTQYAEHESHIAWDDVDNFMGIKQPDNYNLSTVSDLVHYANPGTNDMRTKTWFLVATNFKMTDVTGTITGIEVKLDTRRGGRVSDETVELYLGDTSISDNGATPELDMIKTYGGSSNLWGLESLDLSTLQRPDFGILLRFQSHPFWPHRSQMLINSAAIRVWTT